MNINNVLSIVTVMYTIGCTSASNTLDFYFKDDNNGFKALVNYHHGYANLTVETDNIYHLAFRVSQFFNSIVSFAEAGRETFELNNKYKYSLKPNKNGFYESLSFHGFKCSKALDSIGFNGTMDYQPTVIIGFDSAQDANLPHIITNYISIMNFNINNPNNNDVINLKGFTTNNTTGLSFNVPLRVNGLTYTNYNRK